MRKIVPCFFVYFTAFFSATFSADYYVSPSGDNGNSGSCESPFRTIGKAFREALPGDTIYLQDGVYEQTKIKTEKSGDLNKKITLKAINPRRATITYDPETNFTTSIIDVRHPHITIEGIIFDGQFVMDRPIRVQNGASGLTFTNIEVKNAINNCIDMSASEIRNNILIERSEIHHCIRGDETDQKDAHGVTGSTVRNLTIRDTKIYYVTGDAVQFDPQRRDTHWELSIENCHFWTGPLPAAVPGFTAGFVIGENAFDSKHNGNVATRSTLVVHNSIFNGWKDNPLINVEAALNIKEMVTATVEGNTFFDNENAMRLRGRENDGGAHVTAVNNVFYNNNFGIRYEDSIRNLRIHNNTFGPVNDRHLRPAPSTSGADLETFEVLNNLFLDETKPVQAIDPSNLSVDASVFVDTVNNNYKLVEGSAPINAGISLSGVVRDKDGIPRPQEAIYDIGAFEFRANAVPTVENPIPDQMTTANQTFILCFPNNTFNDPEDGFRLVYSVTLADDSPLPSWLSFDNVRREIAGIPIDTDIGVISVKLTGTDSGELMASDVFDITIVEATTFNLSIHKGWNLVSIPITIEANIDDLFGDAIVGTVWEWSGRKNISPVPKNTKLRPKIGYWIYCGYNDIITVTGVPLADQRIYLGNQWNLVGPVKDSPFQDPVVAIADALDQEDLFRSLIWTWDNTSFIHANKLEIGKGFLVYTDQPLENGVTYEIRFDTNFSLDTHPFNFPPEAHFSELVGAVHNTTVSFWKAGENASPGLIHLSEFGCSTLLDNNIEAELDNGNIFSSINVMPNLPATGTVVTFVEFQRNYPLITFVAKITPSPDWFVGVDSLNLIENNDWINEVTLDLFAYDAGTDSGVHYLSDDQITNPPDSISPITRSPFFVGCNVLPLGTVTLTKR